VNLRGNDNRNAHGGDLDALKQISQLPGEKLMRDFLEVIFNYELTQGEDAHFKYMDTYRNVVKAIVEKKQGESR
jgi:hypothetical protein